MKFHPRYARNLLIPALALPALIASSIFLNLQSPAHAESTEKDKLLLAEHTKRFQYKEGFERRPKDIINTLKDNEVTRFRTLLEGLDQSYGLDATLKNKGPYTLFAPTDRAWKAMPADDRMKLFANRKKLHQVLSYMAVEGKLTYDDLKDKESLKTIEGSEMKVRMRHGDLWVDNALVNTADLECSNGIIHVIDSVIMPALKQ